MNNSDYELPDMSWLCDKLLYSNTPLGLLIEMWEICNKQKARAAEKTKGQSLELGEGLARVTVGALFFTYMMAGRIGLIAATEDQNDNLTWNAGINTITVAFQMVSVPENRIQTLLLATRALALEMV